ncbi:unnamed protein product [Citrullus colocynthis]|uniref:Uncharacterized protein n=1 Tax=Citrullus colocynthis TaxID=252529 RepID=A0ABP0YEG9_9ROSI
MFLTVYRIALLLRRLAEKLKDWMINMLLHLAVSGDASQLVELLTVQMKHCVMQTLGIFHILIMNSIASLLYLFCLWFIAPDIKIL